VNTASVSFGIMRDMIGLGTLINIGTIVAGSAIGVAIGSKLPERTNRVVTDALGLITLVMGGLNLAALGDAELVAAVGPAAPFLIIVGALLIGSIIGSLVGIESRLESFGSFLHAKVGAKSGSAANSARERFIQGFVDASLIFAIGPLAILGAFSDGMGLGIDQLVLKSILDGFASITARSVPPRRASCASARVASPLASRLARVARRVRPAAPGLVDIASPPHAGERLLAAPASGRVIGSPP
jgi:uncharacterized membrane protein YqgA involved in biofilm formation